MSTITAFAHEQRPCQKKSGLENGECEGFAYPSPRLIMDTDGNASLRHERYPKRLHEVIGDRGAINRDLLLQTSSLELN